MSLLAPRMVRGKHERGGQVCERAGEGEDELADTLVRKLLALGVGVGKEAAEGKQQNGAQAQAEPCGDHQARDFAGDDGGDAG